MRKTIVVSDLTGKQVVDPVQVKIMYPDGSRVVIDANAQEIDKIASKGQKQKAPGRKKASS